MNKKSIKLVYVFILFYVLGSFLSNLLPSDYNSTKFLIIENKKNEKVILEEIGEIKNNIINIKNNSIITLDNTYNQKDNFIIKNNSLIIFNYKEFLENDYILSIKYSQEKEKYNVITQYEFKKQYSFFPFFYAKKLRTEKINIILK